VTAVVASTGAAKDMAPKPRMARKMVFANCMVMFWLVKIVVCDSDS
jgi:hypothetical protein